MNNKVIIDLLKELYDEGILGIELWNFETIIDLLSEDTPTK